MDKDFLHLFPQSTHYQSRNKEQAGCQWLTPIILDTPEAEIGGSCFEARPGKWFLRPYLNKTLHKKGLAG
jgi:hypothetical protein